MYQGEPLVIWSIFENAAAKAMLEILAGRKAA
jgi:hypothetical protein